MARIALIAVPVLISHLALAVLRVLPVLLAVALPPLVLPVLAIVPVGSAVLPVVAIVLRPWCVPIFYAMLNCPFVSWIICALVR